MAHTPGPWKLKCIKHVTNGRQYYIKTDDESTFIAHMSLNSGRDRVVENAKFIVRACNSHGDLLAACKEFVRKCECGEARSKRSYAQMKAAIAKAEGK